MASETDPCAQCHDRLNEQRDEIARLERELAEAKGRVAAVLKAADHPNRGRLRGADWESLDFIRSTLRPPAG